MPTEVKVSGRAELERAFAELGRDVRVGMRPALREVGEVVRADAQSRAGANIRNIGPTWERMRLGVTLRAVYIAPRTHANGGSPRPNLAPLLMDMAMQPALDAHQEAALARIDELVNRSADEAGF